MKRTTNALELMDAWYGDDPEYHRLVEEERVMSRAARAIREARIQAGLTQAQLAERIGTQQSAIARLEDGDYEGHTLATLERIAKALDQQVDVRFVPTSAK